ncbi:MAG: hypothetical protein SPLUMA2_SPLUMAMAG2_01254 [uncultured Sulfurimonas sp.]|nr:MAG: hypothetical protein SPLUMA1_SPLUMAMAG1_00060 [uncultured Sulfurimonas sp.]CAI6165382.1 MAG: hypothetical protein SPLUMA2_SPLUMAMAG2_01254 [uncultured Sulfurimonas sp.]
MQISPNIASTAVPLNSDAVKTNFTEKLSKQEAGVLVAEDGFFGVGQTSECIANFVVIAGSGGDEDRLRAGREGMLQGFKDAESMWGGTLPDISQQTMKAALELVDKEMKSLGFSILNQEVSSLIV